MPDQFWIFIVVIVVINIVKLASRQRRSSSRRPSQPGSSSRRWDPVDLPPDRAGPQATAPEGGWPLGIAPDGLATFTTLRAPGGRVGPVVTRVGSFPLAGELVDVQLALFTWTWPHRDDGRWETKELPVALVRAPARIPDLRLRRPGKPPAWQGIAASPGRFTVDWGYDIPGSDPRFATLFTPDFVQAMATGYDHLVFEAVGDVLVVAPREPRTAPDPGIRRTPPQRLDPAATTTADELPTLAEQVARLLVTMPDAWWDQVLTDAAAPPSAPAATRAEPTSEAPAAPALAAPAPADSAAPATTDSSPPAGPDDSLPAGDTGWPDAPDPDAEPVWPDRDG